MNKPYIYDFCKMTYKLTDQIKLKMDFHFSCLSGIAFEKFMVPQYSF